MVNYRRLALFGMFEGSIIKRMSISSKVKTDQFNSINEFAGFPASMKILDWQGFPTSLHNEPYMNQRKINNLRLENEGIKGVS